MSGRLSVPFASAREIVKARCTWICAPLGPIIMILCSSVCEALAYGRHRAAAILEHCAAM